MHITLNPLADKVSGSTGHINLQLAWPAALDVDNTTTGAQGVTKVTAVLYNFPANDEVPDSTQNVTSFGDATIGSIACKTMTVAYPSKPAGAYKLRLTFYRGDGTMVIGYFTEVVTVWPNSTANTWINAEGTAQDTRLFTQEEFYSAAAAVDSISVQKDGTVLTVDDLDLDGINKGVKESLNTGDTLTFTIKFDADDEPLSGKSLKSVKSFVNGDTSGTDHFSGFAYRYEDGGGGYVSTGDITVPSDPNSYRIDICIQAPDRVSTKTYSFTFGTVLLGDTPPAYYVTLAGAFGAATSTNSNAPDIITIHENISMTTVHTVPSNKHISITVPAGEDITLSRAASNTSNAFFIINAGSLTLSAPESSSLILDGNIGMTPTAALVNVNNSGGTFKLNSGVTLQNNKRSASIESNTGGGVYVSYGTFTMNGGTISDNSAHSGGGVYVTNGTFNMNGGTISDNSAQHGGGVYLQSGTFTMTNGEINNNTSSAAVYMEWGTFDMQGGSISGNGGYAFNDNAFGNYKTLKMSGDAYIAPDNPMFHSNYTAFQVTGPLTGTEPVATITPSSYSIGMQILTASEYVSANHTKFAVSHPAAEPSSLYRIDNTGKLETYTMASGGTRSFVTEGGYLYEIHTFTTTGSSALTVNTTPAAGTVDYLIVAGGGGGGHSGSASHPAGGGGAGGLIYLQNQTLTAGDYTVTVGAGGTGGAAMNQNGSNGDNSVFGTATAVGGGGGGFHKSGAASGGNDGGSGGGTGLTGFGSPGNGTDSQGNMGGAGSSGCGGGGAGAAASGQNGGTGRAISITGSSSSYAGGGSGGLGDADSSAGGGKPSVNAGNGYNNTGGGGAGGLNSAGGNGGSGIVIVRFRVQ